MKSNQEVIEKFEELVSGFAGAKYGVAVDCCSHAIYLSLRWWKHAMDTYCPDYVEVPKMTYVSVPAMAIHAGYKVKFTDKEWSGNYKLDPTMVVDGAGRWKKGMYIPGSLYCVSFHYKKKLSTGKGGMILTDDFEAVKWLRKARFAGRDVEGYFDIKDIDVLGWHMQMTPETAARGIEEFYSLDDEYPDFGSSENRLDLSKFSAFKPHLK